MDTNDKKDVRIDIAPEVAGGVYSNMALVSHSPADFVLDFLCNMPGLPAPQMKSRIVMAPQNAKLLAQTLLENVRNYEQRFGSIEIHQNSPKINFTPDGSKPYGDA